MKKLTIQFWKAEKALAMQILEQEGLPKEKGGFVHIIDSPALDFELGVWLRGYRHGADFDLETISLNSNAERDAYLNKVVNAITDELFTGKGELKIGEMCEVKYGEDDIWRKRKLLAILPKQYKQRFIVETKKCSELHSPWTYARPIAKQTKPTIEEYGQLVTYTWEE